MDEHTNNIRKFWDDRAKEFGEDWRATLGEKYLRLLEINTMIKLIKKYKPKKVLDVGCGNGYSTKILANKFPAIKFVGIDYSSEMVFQAKKNPFNNCNFFVGDVLYLETLPKGEFDLIFTQRCLQNIPDYGKQKNAIRNLLVKSSIDGILLLMECSKDGVEKLNNLRIKMGLLPIDNIEPWHNNFFLDENLAKDFSANIFHFTSTYMFLSKIIHRSLARVSFMLPAIGSFGYDKLYIIKKKEFVINAKQ